MSHPQTEKFNEAKHEAVSERLITGYRDMLRVKKTILSFDYTVLDARCSSDIIAADLIEIDGLIESDRRIALQYILQ